jgi:NRAMP (natural resistance-associated macrophage protein)-like metal ion transporter
VSAARALLPRPPAAARSWFQSRWRGLLIFFSVVGPGIITANVDNDAGGITTYSLAGAHYGQTLLWSLIPITLALVLIQEMTSRLGVVSGQGLSDLIRERFGVKITFYLMIGLIITNFGNAVAEFAGIASAMEIFGVSKYLSVPVGGFLVWWMVVKGTYRSVEKIFLVACVFYISYIVAGIKIAPHWPGLLAATLKPHLEMKTDFLVMLTGVIGTTIAPWMQFYQQAAIVEKGVRIEEYRYARWDVIIGSVMVNVVAFFIIVTCAETLFKSGIRIETAKDAALALAPLAGKYNAYLFAFGLLNASLFAASILPLSTAYSVCEGMGWEIGVNKKFTEAPQFYGLYTLIIFISMGIVLLPDFPLIKIMYLSQVLNGLVLPFILIFMLMLVNDRELMGEYANGRWANVAGITCVAVMILLSIVLVLSPLFT